MQDIDVTISEPGAVRSIYLSGLVGNDESQYPDNSIKTSKYSKSNFIPKSLFIQFTNPAKVWFLLISILELSSINENITVKIGTILPLLILIIIEAVREAFNDYFRHSSDNSLNSVDYSVWDGKKFVVKKCKEIIVGDILVIYNKDNVPADILILASGNSGNECYLDASAVSGESSLKVKHSVKETQMILDSLDLSDVTSRLKNLNAEVHVNLPSADFKKFSGRLKLRVSYKSTKLSLDNLIFRDMKIVNTPWIIAMAVYTGHETKVWANNSKPNQQKSKLRKILEGWIVIFFPFVVVFAVINTICYVSMHKVKDYPWPSILASNLIYFGHMIPISLALSIEIIRISFSSVMHKNSLFRLNNSNLYSNLGMVEYIVADKTGTITENELKICFCLVLDKIYWDSDSFEPEEKPSDSMILNKSPSMHYMERFDDLFTLNDLSNTFVNNSKDRILLNYLLCMALCNLAFPDENDYIAISIDDKEMARTASKLGVKLLERDSSQIYIETLGNEEEFELIAHQQFSSTKKKSRVLVRNCINNKVFLYVKGSRENMIPLFNENYSEEEIIEGYRCIFMGYKEISQKECEDFSLEYYTAKASPVNKDGRIESVFQKHEKNLEYLGMIGLDDSVSKETVKTIRLLKRAGIKFWMLSGDSEDSTLAAASAAEIISKNDTILCMNDFTSELDFLNVVQDYIKKGIFEGSEEIINEDQGDPVAEESMSFSDFDNRTRRQTSRFRATEVHRSVITLRNSQSIAAKDYHRSKSRVISRVHELTVNPMISRLTAKPKKIPLAAYTPEKVNYVLSVDSSGLEFALSSKENSRYFISLIFAAKAVCFHGLFPDDKRKVVKILKGNFSFHPLIMAVGDGVSDIGMIQEADIGVGILGNEGNEAANNSDIAIKHFSQLKRLILLNGHRQYIMFSKMVLLSVYAMVLFETEIFMLNIVTGFTSSEIFPKEFVVIYRLVACIIPISGMCLLDKDSSSTSITPQAYKIGIFNNLLTKKNLLIYVCVAIFQGFITFIFTYLEFSSISANGYTENLLLIGTVLTIITFSSVMVSSLVETYSISIKTISMYLASGVILLVVCMLSSIFNPEFEGSLTMISQTGTLWFLVVVIAMNVTVTYFFKCLRYIFYPGILEYVRKVSPEFSLVKQTRLHSFRHSLKKVYKDSSLLNKNIVNDSEKINLKVMKFSSEFREELYQDDKIVENSRFIFLFLMISGLGTLAYAINALIVNEFEVGSLIYLLLLALGFTTASLFPYVIRFKAHTQKFLVAMLFLTQGYFFLSDIIFGEYSLDMYSYIPLIYMVGFSNFWLTMTISSFLNSVFLIISLSIYVTVLNTFDQIEFIICYLTVYFSLLSTCSIASYFIDKSGRIEFNLIQQVQVEIQKTKSVLSYLLPAFVRKRVKDGVRYIAEDKGIISILFCDIYNFEDLLRIYNPQELTAFLDDLFAKIDQKCSLSGCIKIETVGKTYMACAGLSDSEIELDQQFLSVSHARRVVEMGISIINLCENTFLKNGENLKVKIGINSGPVTAGVVGYHKPQFSLVGDTVNTASRMASLCPGANMIQISDKTYKIIDNIDGLEFKPFKVNAKGKGDLDTFLVSIHIKESFSGISDSSSFKGTSIKHTKITKKLTMYRLSTLHNPKRRSSMLENLNHVILEEAGEFRRNETAQLEEIRFCNFGCRESMNEKKFRIESSDTNKVVSKTGLKIRIFCDLVFLSFSIIGSAAFTEFQYYTLIKLVIEVLTFSVLLLIFDNNFKKIGFTWALGISYVVFAVLRLFDYEKNYEIVFVDYLLYLLQASLCSQFLFHTLVWSNSLVAAFQIYSCLSQTSIKSNHIVSSLIFLVSLLCIIYNRERKIRIFSRIKSSADKELQKTDELLTKMMPRNVLEKLKEQNHVTEYIHGVSILYADIAGFTQWSSDKSPDQVVGMLSKLFTEFDHKCVDFDVYKVHTIGDCYVALGYTGNKNRSEKDECYNLAQFGLALVKSIEEVNSKHSISLGMRIGIHTGDIIGGIAGTNIIRYDIYGADVLMANKMESTGKVGKVHISHDTKKILKYHFPNQFKYEEAEKINSPITGELVPTYFLEINQSTQD